MRRVIVLCVLLLAAAAQGTRAEVPQTISYQGMLKEADGTLVPDGEYEVTFRLYDAATGGAPVWEESRTVDVSEGIFNVILGKSVSLAVLAFDETYWLSVEIDGEGELEPRVELTGAPYAFRAAVAESLVSMTADGDWVISGNDMYSAVPGNVGIGTAAPDPGYKLHVQRDGNNYAKLAGSGGQGVYGRGTSAGVSGTGNMGVLGYSAWGYGEPPYDTAVGVKGNGSRWGVIGESQGAFPAYRGAGVLGLADGNAYAGWFKGDVNVEGQVAMTGFQMATGAASGYVLTSDASGVGTWAPGGGAAGGWTDMGTVVRLTNPTDKIGIGTSNPDQPVNVERGAFGSVPAAVKIKGYGPTPVPWSYLLLGKSRGMNPGQNVTTWAGDTLGVIDGFGIGSATNAEAVGARILFVQEGEGPADMVHASIRFNTCDGSGPAAERVRIDPGGDVDIQGNVSISGELNMNQQKIRSLADPYSSDEAATKGYVDGRWTLSGTDLYSTPGGNVGIGTPAPAAKLHVNGSVRIDNQLDMTSGKITNVASPENAQDAATKSYVDNLAAGAGDITAVFADAGLTGGAASGDAHLSVGAGDGVEVLDDLVKVRVADFAGSGLAAAGNDLSVGAGDGIEVLDDVVRVRVTDFAGSGLGVTSNDLAVNTGTGLRISSDEVKLTDEYETGSAYDSRFLNSNQREDMVAADGSYVLNVNNTAGGDGVHATTAASGGAALVALATATSGTNYGIVATSASSAGYAGWFNGKVHVDVLEIAGGGDLAEPFPISNETELGPGTVVVIDDQSPGHLRMSDRAYDTRVAGVISGANGLNAGVTLLHAEAFENGQKVALTGRVWCWADASYGAIEPGDRLTTSETAGHAMKAGDGSRAVGAVIGKAMTRLAEGRGLVLVLIQPQ